MTTDPGRSVFLTGGVGYLGSHLALRLLESSACARLVFVARARDGISAESRVWQSLRIARDVAGDTGEFPERWRDRIRTVDCGDLAHPPLGLAQALQPFVQVGTSVEFYHCAAAVAFSELQEGAVWNNNLAALESVLTAASALRCAAFNHVSTAYVAGDRQGNLIESVGPRPAHFNNIYEESKYACEEQVVAFSEGTALPYRIHRPSIIIGHSRTRRTSSRAGLYYCLDIVRRFYQKVTFGEAAFFRNRHLKVLLDSDATLNLIPVDIVVEEMLAIEAAGVGTLGKVFHQTNPAPLALVDAVAALSHTLGIPEVTIVGSESELGIVDRIFHKKMKLLNPYLSRSSHFDRANVIACGADRHHLGGIVDSAALETYASAYLSDFR